MSEETNQVPGAAPAPASEKPTLKLRPVIRPVGASAPAAAPAPAAPAAAAPAPAPAAAPGAPTIRKPAIGIRKPVIGAPARPAPAAPAAPADASKNPKSVTAPIGALHKTGIVAEGVLTPAQQQAAKSKTSRISLESAMGVAPTKAPTPLKTIRIRRPGDISSAPTVGPGGASAPAGASAAKPAAPSLTQRKTLKIHRPGEGAAKPPVPPAAAPAPAAPQPLTLKKPQTDDSVPAVAPAAFAPPVEDPGTLAPVPGWLMVISTIAALAVLGITGFTAYRMYTIGAGPHAGGNCVAFMKDPKPSKTDWCHPDSKGLPSAPAAEEAGEESASGEQPDAADED